ncbi:MAG TPA: hypothetical protein VEF71_16920 [Streptosporangiaceae bacterium]|nr:hypothetical protein [Streptosporangiaceae bacterium]
MATLKYASVAIGKIQFGGEEGSSANVAVPPLTADAEAEGVLVVLLLLLLHAAIAMVLAAVRASPAMILLRNLIVGPPSSPRSRL